MTLHTLVPPGLDFKINLTFKWSFLSKVYPTFLPLHENPSLGLNGKTSAKGFKNSSSKQPLEHFQTCAHILNWTYAGKKKGYNLEAVNHTCLSRCVYSNVQK